MLWSKKDLNGYRLVCGLLLLCAYGCLKEPDRQCEEEVLLYVKVVDPSTGTDITSTKTIDRADLFMFDQDSCFIGHITISSDSIKQGMPINITIPKTQSILISAWGNLNGSQFVPTASSGCHISDLSVTLKTGNDGYCQCPNDLFFGLKQIGPVATRGTKNEENIVISRKNARINITVRGLPEGINVSDYYFIICHENNGYNFKGTPICNAIEMKQTGQFRPGSSDFVTLGAFDIIHTTSSNQGITINLYQSGTVIASVAQDNNGNPIIPASSETTNILIDLTTMVVLIEITPWNEVYHWVDW